jgi:hypothetical protein
MAIPPPRTKEPTNFLSMRQNYNGLLALIDGKRCARKTSLIQGFAGKGAMVAAMGPLLVAFWSARIKKRCAPRSPRLLRRGKRTCPNFQRLVILHI